MNIGETLFPLGVKMAMVGGATWLILLVGIFSGNLRLNIFELLFLLAPCVAVPLALSLVPITQTGRLSRLNIEVIRYLVGPGAVLIFASFFLPDGRQAGALTCLWLIAGVALALDGLARLVGTRLQSF